MFVCIARFMKGWIGVIWLHLVLSPQIVVQTKPRSVKQLLKAQVCTWFSRKVNDSVSLLPTARSNSSLLLVSLLCAIARFY